MAIHFSARTPARVGGSHAHSDRIRERRASPSALQNAEMVALELLGRDGLEGEDEAVSAVQAVLELALVQVLTGLLEY